MSRLSLCQRDKARHDGPKGLLLPLDIPCRKWESVSMLFIVQLPRIKKGNSRILAFVDRLTKMTHLTALPENATAETMPHAFRREVFRLHGLPRSIITNRDSKFIGRFWSELLRVLGTSRNLSTACHPQSDGHTERMNAVLEDMVWR